MLAKILFKARPLDSGVSLHSCLVAMNGRSIDLDRNGFNRTWILDEDAVECGLRMRVQFGANRLVNGYIRLFAKIDNCLGDAINAQARCFASI